MIYSNTKHGIEIDANSGNAVYGNVVFNNSIAGIMAFADAQPTLTGTQIYNNTIYGNDLFGIYLLGSGTVGGCMDNVVINNIVMNTISGPNLVATNGCENPGANGSGNIYTYNSFGPASVNFIQWGIYTLRGAPVYESTYDAWETAAGNCGESGCSHSVEAAPVFTGVSTKNFTLINSSPGIGAGLNLAQAYEEDLNPVSTWPSNVLLENQNNDGARWDIGAYYSAKAGGRQY
jgi:hypothetical protein